MWHGSKNILFSFTGSAFEGVKTSVSRSQYLVIVITLSLPFFQSQLQNEICMIASSLMDQWATKQQLHDALPYVFRA